MAQTNEGEQMKSFTFKHMEETYIVSLDWLATRNMDILEARNHIDTNSIYLFDGRTVSELKEGYAQYKAQGGKLKKLEYLNDITMKRFGKKWNDVIECARKNMQQQFNNQFDWITEDDHKRLNSLARSGHAFAAYTIGSQLMKQDKNGDELGAVRFLVNAHNYGHVGALYRLSGYMARKGNFEAALTCLVISADCGNDTAALSIPHLETMGYLTNAANNTNSLTTLLDDLAGTSRFSTARYLQFIVMLLSDDKRCVSKLDDIIHCPQNPPKEKDMDTHYKKRAEVLSDFFVQLRGKLVDTNGELKAIPFKERVQAYKTLAASKEYHFIKFADFMELDDFLD